MILGFFALKRRGIITRSTAVCRSTRLLTAGAQERSNWGSQIIHYQQLVLMTQGVHPASSWATLIEHSLEKLRSYRFAIRPSSKKRGLFGDHLTRTRKLSPVVPKILGWRRPGKIGRCQHSIVSIFLYPKRIPLCLQPLKVGCDYLWCISFYAYRVDYSDFVEET